MRRREFVKLLGAAARLLGRWSLAQNNRAGTRRLGVLMSVQDDAEGKAQLSGFTQALAGLGWIEGRNLQTDVRWGGGDASSKSIYNILNAYDIALGFLKERIPGRCNSGARFLWLPHEQGKAYPYSD